MKVTIKKKEEFEPKKVSSLCDVGKETFIEFGDGAIGIVINAVRVMDNFVEDGKTIFMVMANSSLFAGYITNEYLNEFKEGNYKRLFKGDLIIEERD